MHIISAFKENLLVLSVWNKQAEMKCFIFPAEITSETFTCLWLVYFSNKLHYLLEDLSKSLVDDSQ